GRPRCRSAELPGPSGVATIPATGPHGQAPPRNPHRRASRRNRLVRIEARLAHGPGLIGEVIVDEEPFDHVPTDKSKRIWKGSWIYEEAHTQVCIRSQKNILAVWHVGPDGRYGKGGGGRVPD